MNVFLKWNRAATRSLVIAAIAVSFVGFSHQSVAEYPEKPVRLIVPFTAGGVSDQVARYFADRASQILGQPFVVENRAGAGGAIGAELVARAAPDGYTLLEATAGVVAILPHVQKDLPYKPLEDLTPIASFYAGNIYIGINKDLPVKNLQEFVAYAKARPGKLNFASAGIGSIGHILSEMLMSEAGIQMVHIPYKGSAQAMTDMLAGRVQLMIDPIVLQQAEGGKVRLLANANTQRWVGQPDIPSMSEVYPNYRWASGLGIVGPAKMPKEIVDKLNATVRKIFDTDEGRAYLTTVAGVPQPISPEQYGQEIREWHKRVGDIAARVDIKSGAN